MLETSQARAAQASLPIGQACIVKHEPLRRAWCTMSIMAIKIDSRQPQLACVL
jgi:hypothetical protein